MLDKTQFAIKVVKKATLKSSRQKAYLKHEIEVLRMMNHPGIVKTYEVHELENYLAIVQDFIDGQSLSQFIKDENNNLNEFNALAITHELLLALYHLHNKDYMHRDIKPGNIMLRKTTKNTNSESFQANWSVVLIDFGLCAPNWDHTESSFLNDRSGTVGYLSPELIEKGTERAFYDKKIDVFSVGIVLLEM